jgi:hypothetical protein
MGVALPCGAVTDNKQTAFSLLTCIKISRELIQDGSFFYANELVTLLWNDSIRCNDYVRYRRLVQAIK